MSTYRDSIVGLGDGKYMGKPGCIEIACRLAAKFPEDIPNYRQVMNFMGCSPATAFRWIRGMKDARGISE